jgi:hypothetical protein
MVRKGEAMGKDTASLVIDYLNDESVSNTYNPECGK